MAPEKAAAEIARLRGLEQYQRGDKLTLDHVNLLGKIASRNQSRELKAPPQVVPSAGTQARQKLEAEARTIHQDKGYWDKSAPNFRALQARMGEIMRQLHGEV